MPLPLWFVTGQIAAWQETARNVAFPSSVASRAGDFADWGSVESNTLLYTLVPVWCGAQLF